MTKRVFFALLDESQNHWEGEAGRLQKIHEVRSHGGGAYGIGEQAADADLIVFLESNGYKDWRFTDRLLAHACLRDFPARCFTLNYADTPVAFLPGVYASLPRAQHEALRTTAGGYHWGNPNPVLAEFEHAQVAPTLLFSFRGANSHPLRAALFARAGAWRKHGLVAHVDRWFNHSPDEARAYAAEIVSSRFALCPRGIGCATHRVFEVMRLGRAAVVIADQWVEPPGPDWSRCILRVPEARIDEIPALLEARAAEAAAMGRAAREAWERWFAPGVVLVRQLDALCGLKPVANLAALRARWRSYRFRRDNGWTLPQRLQRRIARLVARR
jgi:hypothetical protein